MRYRGYDKKEVESFIVETQSKNETTLASQRERIASLLRDNDDLKAKLAVLQSREEQIKLTLLKATKTADELGEQIRSRFKEELDRLRFFRAKWTAAYEELKDRYHFSKDALNMESVAVQTELDLTRYLTQEFSLNRGDETDDMEAYFKKEVERLTALQQTMQKETESKSKDVKEKLRLASKKAQESVDEGAFSMDEALHPTESLEEICQSLGLSNME